MIGLYARGSSDARSKGGLQNVGKVAEVSGRSRKDTWTWDLGCLDAHTAKTETGAVRSRHRCSGGSLRTGAVVDGSGETSMGGSVLIPRPLTLQPPNERRRERERSNQNFAPLFANTGCGRVIRIWGWV